MQDPRWSQLKQNLLGRGWTWRDDTLYAPHETMWFTTTVERPNMASFRERMTAAAEAAAIYAAGGGGRDQVPLDERKQLRDDLVSLVAALDEMLDSNN